MWVARTGALVMFPQLFATIQWLHIPDGFLSLPISIVCWLLTAAALTIAVRNAQEDLDDRLIPLAGVMAAFIFAGQMINFPVAGGTSGHLVGATLAAIVLGPWLAILVMTAVISLQALLFQDGGLVVMGANILVMGVVPVMVGYGFYRTVVNKSRRWKLVSTAVSAWLSIESAAFITALLLGVSATSSLSIAIPAMLIVHALIGIGEALITIFALNFIMRTRPQLLEKSGEAGGRGWIVAGMLVALFVVFLAPFASTSPDGLMKVATQIGFVDTAVATPFEILPDYTVPFLGEVGVSKLLAGVIGTLAVAAIVYCLTWFVRRGKNTV